MLFIIIGIVFGFITMIALFGDYEEKELQKWKDKWEEITRHKYW